MVGFIWHISHRYKWQKKLGLGVLISEARSWTDPLMSISFAAGSYCGGNITYLLLARHESFAVASSILTLFYLDETI